MVNPLIGNKDLKNDKNVKFSDASYLLYYAKNASIFFNTFLFCIIGEVIQSLEVSKTFGCVLKQEKIEMKLSRNVLLKYK